MYSSFRFPQRLSFCLSRSHKVRTESSTPKTNRNRERLAMPSPSRTERPRSTFAVNNSCLHAFVFCFNQAFSSLYQLNQFTQLSMFQAANQPEVPKATPVPGYERPFLPMQMTSVDIASGKSITSLVLYIDHDLKIFPTGRLKRFTFSSFWHSLEHGK